MAGARTRSGWRSRATTGRAARLLWSSPRRPPAALLRSVAALWSTLAAASALAADPPAPVVAASASAPASRIVEVRIALSSEVLKKISEPRLRRLLEIELEDSAVLAPGAAGPLGDHVAYIWVDRPTPNRIAIEVRVGDRAVGRREIAAAGLSGDVAARLVAIAASEMVRDQMEPVRAAPRKPPAPRRPTEAEIELASRGQPGIQLLAAADIAFAPKDAAVLAGPSLGVGFRYYGVSETLFARWLTGPSRAGSLRWLEIGLAADYRLWLSPSFRLAFGAEAAFASAHLGDATVPYGAPGERDTWSTRAGGRIGAELHLGGPIWLNLTATPGAILRPVHHEAPTGKGTFEGLWVGAGLGLTFEWGRKAVLTPVSPPQ
ncbi:MAG: hypothetical protein ABJE95_29795 [Byssovorax sp.]